MSTTTLLKPESTLKKYLVVDDELVLNQDDREDFVLDIGVSEDLALFASSYEEALAIIKEHLDIAICFVDLIIPKNSQDLDSEPDHNNEWGISLIPQINKINKDIDIVVYSAQVTQTYLQNLGKNFKNITGFFGKPDGIRHRKQLYLNAINKASIIEIQKHQTTINQHFDYSILDENLADYIFEKTNIIKKLFKRTIQDTLDIGQALIEIKAKLNYGQFITWLNSEFNWNERTAQRYMKVAKEFQNENLLGLDIMPSALYELSTSSTPEPAKQEAIFRAKKGEKISLKIAKEIKNKFLQPTSIQQDIIQIIPRQSVWQLDRHMVFCADPNSPRLIEQLPPKISLCLAFPPVEHWQFQLNCRKSLMNFYSEHQDIDHLMLMESVDRVIQITTSELDNIVVCFIPHPSILFVIHQLGCTGFIVEPDYEKCLDLINFFG
jgi:CheY-like chemotaxis protein